MEALPFLLVATGVLLVVAGIAFGVGRAAGLARLPGDLRARRGPVTIYAPLGTSLLVSLLLTVALNAALCGTLR